MKEKIVDFTSSSKTLNDEVLFLEKKKKEMNEFKEIFNSINNNINSFKIILPGVLLKNSSFYLKDGIKNDKNKLELSSNDFYKNVKEIKSNVTKRINDLNEVGKIGNIGNNNIEVENLMNNIGGTFDQKKPKKIQINKDLLKYGEVKNEGNFNDITTIQDVINHEVGHLIGNKNLENIKYLNDPEHKFIEGANCLYVYLKYGSGIPKNYKTHYNFVNDLIKKNNISNGEFLKIYENDGVGSLGLKLGIK